MQLEYRIRLDEFREANRLMLRRYAPVLYAYANFAPLVGVFSLAYLAAPYLLHTDSIGEYNMSTVGSVCAVFVVIVALLLVPVGIRSSVGRAYYSNSELRHRFQVEITPDWFSLHSTSGCTQSCRLSSYNEVLEGRHVFVLSRSSQAFSTIPKAGLGSEQLDELRRLLYAGVGSAEPMGAAEPLS